MTPEDPERLADELDTEADRLQQRSDEVGAQIAATRHEWETKRADGSVPGANPPERPEREDAPGEGEPEGTGEGGPAGIGEPGPTGSGAGD